MAGENEAPEGTSSEVRARESTDRIEEQELPEAVWETVEEPVEKKPVLAELADVDAAGSAEEQAIATPPEATDSAPGVAAAEEVFFGDESVDAIVNADGRDPAELELETPPTSISAATESESEHDQYISGSVAEHFEVVEPTEPTNESAFPLVADESSTAEELPATVADADASG